MATVIKPVSNKVVIESAIDAMNEALELQKSKEREAKMESEKIFRENETILELRDRKRAIQNRFHSFSESVTAALLGESIYRVFAKSMNESVMAQPNMTGIMRAMVGDFITEDANSILSKMRNRSNVLSEMYNLITSTRKSIIESIDKDNPDSFCIKKEIKDEFFEKLDNMDTESISDAIRQRVSDTVNDFITSNREDHDKIMTALQMTKDKLEEKKYDSEEVRESYEHMSKRFIAKIRNREKSVFESMVDAMCESTMKHDELKEEFMEGAKLNIPKIVDRIQTMYTFIETVNTMNLYNIDESYMESLIESLRK